MEESPLTIDALSYELRKFPPSPQFVAAAATNDESLYNEAQRDHEGFWARQAGELISWDTPWETVCEWGLP